MLNSIGKDSHEAMFIDWKIIIQNYLEKFWLTLNIILKDVVVDANLICIPIISLHVLLETLRISIKCERCHWFPPLILLSASIDSVHAYNFQLLLCLRNFSRNIATSWGKKREGRLNGINASRITLNSWRTNGDYLRLSVFKSEAIEDRVSVPLSLPIYIYIHVCVCVYVYVYIYIYFFFLGLHLWHMEVPRLGIESEL